jgi:tRNA dimethylallyltransferase
MSKLIIITGPTASGKTAEAVRLARQLDTEIISCDSRQFYRELDIGVARPSPDELSAAPHHFIACRSVTQPYNISDFEQDAMGVLERLFLSHTTVVAVGGSGLYIDALCKGVARMPDPTPELRSLLQQMPIEEKRARLRLLDPDYYSRVDLRNPVRLQRALEVCLMAGRPYSALLAEQQNVCRPFDIEIRVIGTPTSSLLPLNHEALRQRIDSRVDQMVSSGLVDEVRSVMQYRHLNTLRTVGYSEIFSFLDGATSLDDAVAAIKFNTWHYARKQLTWMRRYVVAAGV